jgi:hypothetical protein
MEFPVGAIPTISCVQSSGTPSAFALLKGIISRKTARQREIGIRKERIFIASPLVFTSAMVAAIFLAVLLL